MLVVAGFVAVIGSFIFGLQAYTPWVILFQAMGLTAMCIPSVKIPARDLAHNALGILALLGLMILGFSWKGGLAYLLGRGLRSLFT